MPEYVTLPGFIINQEAETPVGQMREAWRWDCLQLWV